MAVVNAATITVGASATTNIWAIAGGGTYPEARVIVRTSDTGVLVGGAALAYGVVNGFELLPDQEYVFDLRQGPPEFSADSATYTLHVRNTNSSAVTVSWIATAL